MSSPRISIVTTAYNFERFISETLRCIQNQSFQDWECILIDDGSKDATGEIANTFARQDPRIRVVTTPNGGTVAARNYGFQLTNPNSEYLTFMDGDDLWTPDALQTLLQLSGTHPEAVGAYGWARCIDDHGNPHEDPAYASHGKGRFQCDNWGRFVQLNPLEPSTFRSLWYSNPFPPGLILAKRSAYQKIGLFDSAMAIVEDWDILLRLSRTGDFYFADSPILLYRRHSGNLSARSAPELTHKVRALHHKTFFSAENNPGHRRILRENWRASQFLYTRQKCRAAAAHASNHRYPQAAREIASLSIQFFRLIRGYPSLRGI